jgi:hypothetical protein
MNNRIGRLFKLIQRLAALHRNHMNTFAVSTILSSVSAAKYRQPSTKRLNLDRGVTAPLSVFGSCLIPFIPIFQPIDRPFTPIGR